MIPLHWMFTFGSVAFAWVFFRAASFSRAREILYGMCGGNGALLPPNWVPFSWLQNLLTFFGVHLSVSPHWALTGGKNQILLLALCTLAVVSFPNSYEWTCSHLQNKRPSAWWAVGIGSVLALGICFLNRISEFLYFQF